MEWQPCSVSRSMRALDINGVIERELQGAWCVVVSVQRLET